MCHLKPHNHICLALILLGMPATITSFADDATPTKIKITDRIPFGRSPIDYFSPQVNDAVSRLNERMNSGEITLTPGSHGYLHAVLKQLNIPLESQLLVYSKTARAPELVSPKSPRAIFFNDDVSVAWIPEARELELTAIDPLKGVNFYTLSQPLPDHESESDTIPKFIRRDRCLACHAGRSSLEVPGMLLRAFQTDETGKPQFGFSRVTHETTYDRRWGGWFVTGSPNGLTHRGNLVSRADNDRHKDKPGYHSQIESLSDFFDAGAYPSQSSDFAAHMVFAHQMHGLNLIIRVGMEARLRRQSNAEDQLIDYLTFRNEPPLDPSVMQTRGAPSEFETWFEALGPRTDSGDSLRQFDFKTHLFRHRLSYLIYHKLFDAIPKATRVLILRRLWLGLTSDDPSLAFSHMSNDEKTSIVAIIRDTKRNLPDFRSANSESGSGE